uniref:Plastocyanin-like domain-containing protein n=1 Tax=Nelumbo nucifera TaxID=4432 RepID=A0A822YL50_NELNU|nr:TPA_asm: hypothetical protein HUJ06_010860 [Nelumbo nucifera]
MSNDTPYPYPNGDPVDNLNSKTHQDHPHPPLYINGKRVEDPVIETPKSGTTEIWDVINLTGDNHPLHIHLATYLETRVQPLTNVDQFTGCLTQQYDAVACNVESNLSGQVLDIPANERTWKTTVNLAPGTMTTVVVKFNPVETNSPYPFDPSLAPGYVYHCRILDHEDNALMIRPYWWWFRMEKPNATKAMPVDAPPHRKHYVIFNETLRKPLILIFMNDSKLNFGSWQTVGNGCLTTACFGLRTSWGSSGSFSGRQ